MATLSLKQCAALLNGMDQNDPPLMKRWTNHAITLLLLSALIVAGISVYYTRQEWREMYMRVMKHR
jgi:hypothetical protein